MFCKNCGKELPDDAKFCNHCGAQQNSAHASAQREKNAGHTVNSQQGKTQSQYADMKRTANNPDFSDMEKSFKQYISSHKARNLFILSCVITVACIALPPLAIGLAFLTLVFGLLWFLGCNDVKKCISSAKSAGIYESMLREFSSSTSILDDKVRYGENYIWGKASFDFYSYQNIYWMYRHIMRYLFIPICSEVMIGNDKGKVRTFCKLPLNTQAGGKEIEALAAIVHNKNPKVLLGFEESTQAEYKRRTR